MFPFCGQGGVGGMDVRQIIEQIMNDPRYQRLAARSQGITPGADRNGGPLGREADCAGGPSSRVYEDEPIIKVASQMDGYLPPVYRRARDAARGCEMGRQSWCRLFYEQATVLADAEDDAWYRGHVEGYCPTYQGLDDRQLRGYVTWRTHVRRGEVVPAPKPFIFIYLYELLNGVGAAGPEGALRALLRFWGSYREVEPLINRYLETWVPDYVAYHGLDASLVAAVEPIRSWRVLDEALTTVVVDPQGHTDAERFAAILRLAPPRQGASRFFKDNPADACPVVLAVLGRLETYYRRHRKSGLYDTLFGSRISFPHQMFASAVFYEASRHADTVYEFGPLRKYECRRGVWTRECFPGRGGGNAKLGSILQAVDARMRVRWGYPHLLKEAPVPKYLAAMVDREIDLRLAWKQAHAPLQIAIDRSKLAGIRRASAKTCEELLVDEERADAPCGAGAVAEGAAAACPAVRVPAPQDLSVRAAARAPAAQTSAAQPAVRAPVARPATARPFGLTDDEADLLRILAFDPDAPVPRRCGGVTLDMAVDAINEKLYELLGDTAVEFDGARPALVEDYREDVKGAVWP